MGGGSPAHQPGLLVHSSNLDCSSRGASRQHGPWVRCTQTYYQAKSCTSRVREPGGCSTLPELGAAACHRPAPGHTDSLSSACWQPSPVRWPEQGPSTGPARPSGRTSFHGSYLVLRRVGQIRTDDLSLPKRARWAKLRHNPVLLRGFTQPSTQCPGLRPRWSPVSLHRVSSTTSGRPADLPHQVPYDHPAVTP